MLNEYKKSEDGNIAMMFGIALMVLVVGAGAAVDYATMSSRATTLQDYVDAAVLAAAASKETDQAKLQEVVDKTIAHHNKNGWTIDAPVTVVDDRIRVHAETTYDTMLMGVVGHKKMPVRADTEAPIAEDLPLHVALVLDTTDSMTTDDKIGDLRTAANTLATKLDDNENDQIRMSVVPFSNYVNVGMANRNASWMDVPDDYSTTTPAGACYMHQPRTCTGGYTTQTRTGYRDGVAYTYTTDVCNGYTDDGPEVEICPSDTTTNYVWNGCAGSRNAPDNATPKYAGQDIPGVMNATCGSEILPLGNDFTTIKSSIDGLTATGTTYIPAGLIWGWRTLNKHHPYNQSSALPQKDIMNAMILMSDGGNSMRLDAPYHKADNPPIIDDTNTLTEELCRAIDSEGIQIFTVAYKFEGDEAAAKTMLQNCASTPGNFFDANNAAELNDAFERIGNELFSVRLSK